MKTSLLLLFLGLSLPARTQFDLPVKEQFDNVCHKALFNGTYAGVVSYITDNEYANPWNTYQFGEQVGAFLEAYIHMYETTKDKAYLVRFINLSLKAIAWRRANYYFTDDYYMEKQDYMNGVLLWPMAHFVHLVVADASGLGEEAIPDGLIAYQTSTVAGNILTYQATYTYSELAAWMKNRCLETLFAIIADHWSTLETFGHGERLGAVNFQAPFAATMFYLGHLASLDPQYSGMSSLIDMSALQTSLFRGNEPDDRCHCISGSPVLMEGADNSYFWHHEGWHYTRRDCPFFQCEGASGYALDEANLLDRHEFTEDISHGATDLLIPLLADQFNLSTNGWEPFTSTELVRFRNTFTKRLAEWDSNAWGFHNSVEGYDSPVAQGDANGNFNALKHSSTAWMPLYVYDNAPGAESGPGVYEILTDFYTDEIYPDPTDAVYGGYNLYGMSHVVSAQWDKECFDLTLFNRELVYDQDFAAKHVLTVDPDGEAGASFADPVINEPRFSVNEGITAEFRAGAAVVFEPGFETIPGSTVTAVIDPLGCDMPYRAMIMEVNGPTYANMQVPRADPPAESTAAGMVVGEAIPKDDVRFIHEGTTDQAILRLMLVQDRSVGVEVSDALGKPVLQRAATSLPTGSHDLELELGGLSTGVYFCKVWVDGEPQVFRFVLGER